MAAIANNPKFAKKVGVSQSVGKDFNNADKGKTFKEGGTMKKMNPGMMAMLAKKKAPMATKEMPMKKGGKVKKMMGGGMYAKGGTAKKTTKKMTMGGKAC